MGTSVKATANDVYCGRGASKGREHLPSRRDNPKPTTLGENESAGQKMTIDICLCRGAIRGNSPLEWE